MRGEQMQLRDELLIEMYRRILRIRSFEETVLDLKREAEIPGAAHICIGHEATMVGACMAAGENSFMTGSHRSHGHPIAKGADLRPLMAELLARTTGVCRGKGGSLHLADFAVGSLGESGIVGSSIPVAAGAGLSTRLRGADEVTLSFFGDATSNTGAFHESLNLASVWKLPVVYVCENNGYGVTTPTAHVMNVKDIAERAAAYGIPGATVDGQDPVAVYEAVFRASERARAGEGPTLVEAKTYRFREHAEMLFVADAYRSEDEVSDWVENRDPVRNFREHLVARGVLSETRAAEIVSEVRREVQEAVEFARQSPRCRPQDAFDDLYRDEPVRGKAIAAFSVDRPDPEPRREINYLQAINEAQHEELLRDERVIVFGEDVRANLWGGTAFAKEFPEDRVFDTPLSEAGFAGAAVGAAMTGMRPVVDMTIASFLYVAMDQFVSQAAKSRYMFGGQATIPVTFRSAMMYGINVGAHHSDRPYPMFMNVPGLKIATPASPFDAKGLVKAAIRDDNPVLVFEDVSLWFTTEHVPEEDYIIPFGTADIKRRGSDVTIVAISGGVQAALQGADELAGRGISAEVVDPRTLVPLDERTILESVAKTGHLVVVDPAHQTCSAASEIAARVAEHGFRALRAPIARVTAPDTQIPFAPEMERPLFPNADRVVAAVLRVLGERAAD
jgi:pyruvate/2-oxoglutarate/acetoin dehydrogenase E1 component/TPP-dependent pyruvate/acetoin dehydrogenase alpha subunit